MNVNGFNFEIQYFNDNHYSKQYFAIVAIKNVVYDIKKVIDTIFDIEFYRIMVSYSELANVLTENSEITFQSFVQYNSIPDAFEFSVKIDCLTVVIRLYHVVLDDIECEIDRIYNMISEKTNIKPLKFSKVVKRYENVKTIVGILNTKAIEDIEISSPNYLYKNIYGTFLITDIDLENEILEQLDEEEKERIKKMFVKSKFKNL